MAAELRADLARRRLSAREIGRRTGLDPSTVARAMRGATPISLDAYVSIVASLDGEDEDQIVRKLVGEIHHQAARGAEPA